MRVIGIGDNVCDKYINMKTMFPGGQALNFSVYAKILGAESSYMGVFGNDAVAAHVIKTLDEVGVEHGRCRQYEGENGYAKVALVEGDRTFLGSNKGGVAKVHPLRLEEEDLKYIKRFSLVHTSNNSHFDSQLKYIASVGVPLSYDFSGQWTDREKVAEVAPYASYVFLSCGSVPLDEAKQICEKMSRAGCRMIIATRGSHGALLYDGESFYEQPPKLVDAVDTLGAGDSFATAFLLAFTESMQTDQEQMNAKGEFYREQLKKAMRAGAEFASRTCMVQGAFGHGTSFTE